MKSPLQVWRTVSAESLVNLAQSGDSDAFCELLRRYTPLAQRTAWRLMKNKEDAEDAVQDAFLRAFKKLDGFEGSAAFSTWLTRIVINSCLMHLRRRRAKPTVSLEESHEEETTVPILVADKRPTPEEHYLSVELQCVVHDAITRLPLGMKHALLCRLQTESSVSSIAIAQSTTPAAMKSRLFRARKLLAQTLAPMNLLHQVRCESKSHERSVNRQTSATQWQHAGPDPDASC